MPSFREIIASHGPVLLLDAASARIQVGWLEANRPPRWQTCEADAGVGLFRSLEALAVQPAKAHAFIFCCGPGSVLGVRTTAMTIRTWNAFAARPVFSFHGLALVAHFLGRTDVTIIADARRESWHSYNHEHGLKRVPTAALSGELMLPEGFRTWSTPPESIARVPYSVQTMLAQPAVLDADLLTTADNPDAFLHETPAYATWTPQIHRAP